MNIVADEPGHDDTADRSRVIGTTIGNYEVQRLIAEGGMGKVYLAVHAGLGRQAAVKVLSPCDAADPELVSRFITEARAANGIRHPNIFGSFLRSCSAKRRSAAPDA